MHIVASISGSEGVVQGIFVPIQQYFGFLVAHLSDDGAISSDTGDQRPTTKQLFLYCCESGMYMYDGDDVVI
jgi:hypothetical protein